MKIEIFFFPNSVKTASYYFSEIAAKISYSRLVMNPIECESEDEARDRCLRLIKQKKWPCYFFKE